MLVASGWKRGATRLQHHAKAVVANWNVNPTVMVLIDHGFLVERSRTINRENAHTHTHTHSELIRLQILRLLSTDGCQDATSLGNLQTPYQPPAVGTRTCNFGQELVQLDPDAAYDDWLT